MRLKKSKRNAYIFLKNTLVPASEQTDGPYGAARFFVLQAARRESVFSARKRSPARRLIPFRQERGSTLQTENAPPFFVPELVNCDNNLTF
jgi:hypothetical protein